MQKRTRRLVSLVSIVALLVTMFSSISPQVTGVNAAPPAPNTISSPGLPTPMSTPGPTFTPTATPNEPSSPGPNQPLPTATPYVNPHLPSLVTSVKFGSDQVQAGSSVAVSVTVLNQAPDTAQSLTVNLPLPSGVAAFGQAGVDSTKGGQPAAATAQPTATPTALSWNLTQLAGNNSATFTANLQLSGLSVGDAVVLMPVVTANGLDTADRTSSGVLVVDQSGGPTSVNYTPGNSASLRSTDSQVSVNFPAAAYTSSLTLKHSFQPPTGVNAPPKTSGFKRGFGTFYLSATDAQSRDVHQFSQPLTITVSYNDRQLQALGIQESDLTLYWYDEAAQMWTPLPTKVDHASYTASVQVTHFSDYQLGDGTSASSTYMPNLQGGYTNLFTGASSYSVGIDVPSGPAGIRPNLSLNYSSNATDGKYGQRPKQQASWVGKGWNLDTGSISLNILASNTRGAPYLYHSLALNGQGYDLVGTCKSGGTCSTSDPTQWDWHTTAESFSKILPVQVADSTTNHAGAVYYFRYKWDIWSKDGTMYEYAADNWWGFDNDCASGGGSFMQPYKWNLTSVKDVNGNIISYNYAKATQAATACTTGGILDLDTWPTSITWAGDLNTGSNPRYRVAFTPITRTLDTQFDFASNAMGYTGPHETEQLNNIQVQSNFTGTWQLMRQYNLGYAASGSRMLSDSWTCVPVAGTCPATGQTYQSDPNEKLTLTSIQMQGYNNGLLPATTFTYGNTPGPNTSQYPDGNWNRLTKINNGQNGEVRFAYANIGQAAADTLFQNNRRVTSRTLDTAVNNAAWPKYTYTYSYAHPAYNWLSEGADTNPNSAALFNATNSGNTIQLAHKAYTQFRGHRSVTETAPDGTQTTHTYYQGDAGCTISTVGDSCFGNVLNGEVWTGREYRSLSSDSGTHNLNENWNTYMNQFRSPAYFMSGLWNTYSPISQTLAGSWGDNGSGTWISKTNTTNYYYETQYGNTIQTNEYNASGLVRYTSYQYAVISNTTAYIVDRKSSEDVRNAANQYLSLSLYVYDGNSSNQGWGVLGDGSGNYYGRLTRKINLYDVPLNTSLTGPTMHGVDSTYGYESGGWGNQTSGTTYYASGTNGGAGTALKSGSNWTLNAPGGGATQRVANTYYDGTSHSRMTQSCQPTVTHTSGNVTLCTSYTYNTAYGTKSSVVAPNGGTATYEYDEFGRTSKVIASGDSSSYPTEWYVYHDTEVPVRVEHNKREYVGSPSYLPIQSFYDGLGQEVQTKTEDKWSPSPENIVVSKSYSDRPGLVTQSSQTAYVPSNYTTFWQYQTPTGIVSTTMQYDGLSRIKKVTEPDINVVIFYTYTEVASGSATTVADPNANKKRTEYDTLNRMAKVYELNTNGTTYASTTYAYSPLQDLLTSITNYDGSGTSLFTTSASYDSLGRKTAKNDPDRGNRTYVYDVDSNVVQASDLKSQSIYYTYDEVDRLTQQTYSTNGTTATYEYDQGGTSNYGQRTKMVRQTSPDVISTTWTYDSRGRMSQASYWAGGRGPYIYSYSYNSGDQVNTLNLASGGEVLTYSYDAAWRPTGFTSSLADVSITSANYTALGQRKDMTGGDGGVETWDYISPMQQLSRIRIGTSSSLGAYWDRNYSIYDNAGNIKTVVDNIASATHNYTYDQNNRLSSWAKTGMTTQNYSYNTMGNLTNYAGNVYTYGSPTTPGCTAIHQLCGANSKNFTYDNNGNQAQSGGTYNWNADDQLASYTQGATSESYSYDADGERATRTAGSTTTIYLGPLFELDVQTSNHQTTITRRTFYKLGGNIVAQRNSADTSLIYLHTDHLGSVVKATSLNGASPAVRWTYDYDTWGNITLTAGFTQTLLSYTGLHKDAAQYYAHARYYDASIQHFNSADTIVPDVANPQNLNRYSYVRNSPLRLTDISGHVPSPSSDCGRGDDCNPHKSPTNPWEIWLCTDLSCGGWPGGANPTSLFPFMPNYGNDNQASQIVPLKCGLGGVGFSDEYLGMWDSAWDIRYVCDQDPNIHFIYTSINAILFFQYPPYVTTDFGTTCVFSNRCVHDDLYPDRPIGEAWTGVVWGKTCVLATGINGAPCREAIQNMNSWIVGTPL